MRASAACDSSCDSFCREQRSGVSRQACPGRPNVTTGQSDQQPVEGCTLEKFSQRLLRRRDQPPMDLQELRPTDSTTPLAPMLSVRELEVRFFLSGKQIIRAVDGF